MADAVVGGDRSQRLAGGVPCEDGFRPLVSPSRRHCRGRLAQNRRGVPRTFAVFSPLRQLRTAAPRRNERRLPGRLEPEIPAQRRIGDPETVASLRPKLAKRSIFLERR
jgi:hypothetical protein